MTTQHNTRAACFGEHELFESIDPDDHDEAKAICDRCPMFDACDRMTVDLRSTPTGQLGMAGTWAGKLYGARPGLRLDPEMDLRCGSEAGHAAHRRRGEEICEPCRVAKVSSDRRRRQAATAARREERTAA